MSKRKINDRFSTINPVSPRPIGGSWAAPPGGIMKAIGQNRDIDDIQWRILQKLSGMSDADRVHFEKGVRGHFHFRFFDNIEQSIDTSSETRWRLTDLSVRSKNLALDINSAMLAGLLRSCFTNSDDASYDIKGAYVLSSDLQKFSRLADQAASRCGRTRPGPRSNSLRAFIKYLAQTWTKATGEKASARKARVGPDKTWNFVEFVIEVAKIADPSGPSPEAIRILIKNMSQAREFG